MDKNADPGMAPCRILDAASMLRRSISKNERPYMKAIFKHNNSLVDEWYNKVLVKIADGQGCIRAGQVWGEWQYFEGGKIIPQFMEALNNNHVNRPSKECVTYWVNAISKLSVKELAEFGPGTLGHGWKIILDELHIRSAIEKYEKVYSKSDDPLIWRKLANDNPRLWSIEYGNPFWSKEEFDDVKQKILTILGAKIQPQK